MVDCGLVAEHRVLKLEWRLCLLAWSRSTGRLSGNEQAKLRIVEREVRFYDIIARPRRRDLLWASWRTGG